MAASATSAASEAFIVPGEDSPTAASPVDVSPGPAVAVASPRWPQLIPVAQLLAVVLGVFAIIWNQQQTTDSLRTELRAEISRVETSLRAEMAALETSLRAEINGVDAGLGEEIAGLRAEVRSNGERLARIEGFLGIGIPETATPP